MFSDFKAAGQMTNVVSAQRRAQSGTVLACSDICILMAQVNKRKLY